MHGSRSGPKRAAETGVGQARSEKGTGCPIFSPLALFSRTELDVQMCCDMAWARALWALWAMGEREVQSRHDRIGVDL
jgi:hypothetical protein